MNKTLPKYSAHKKFNLEIIMTDGWIGGILCNYFLSNCFENTWESTSLLYLPFPSQLLSCHHSKSYDLIFMISYLIIYNILRIYCIHVCICICNLLTSLTLILYTCIQSWQLGHGQPMWELDPEEDYFSL